MATHVLSAPVIGYPEKSAVDFSDPETRRRLSPSAIRVFTNIAEKWNLSESQIRSLLGATKTEMSKMDIVLGKLAKSASSMSNTIEAARTRARAVGRKLRTLETVESERADELLELETEFAAIESEEP